jgi:hypothetical protein
MTSDYGQKNVTTSLPINPLDLVTTIESLKSKTGCSEVFSSGHFGFLGFYSEAASPNRRCSLRDLDILHLFGLKRGLASIACIPVRAARFALGKRNLCHFGRTIEPERKAYHADPAAGVDLARADAI